MFRNQFLILFCLLNIFSQFKCFPKANRTFINYLNKGYSFMFDFNNKIEKFSNTNRFLCLNKCLENNYCISAIINKETCTLYYNMDLASNMIDVGGNKLYIKKYVNCETNKIFNGIDCIFPQNCYDWFKYDYKREDGIYSVYPNGTYQLQAYCEMKIGGYTGLMNKTRLTGQFRKTWLQYRNGFGNLTQYYWIGLENIRSLVTQQKMNLYLEMYNTTNNRYNITFGVFSIDDESNRYMLRLDNKLSGNLNAARVIPYHNGTYFGTYDNDYNGCASSFRGGFWFRSCYWFCLTCESATGQYDQNGYTVFNNFKMAVIPSQK